MTINLDTHTVLNFLNRDLTQAEYSLINSYKSFCISDMVLWELAMLSSKNRINFDFDSEEWRQLSETLTILPITEAIAAQSVKMDFKSDPADHIIAATSVVQNIPLMTRDKNILKSKIVPFA
jgi:PIN domain nuclease of toxin-antitoxin system